MSDIFATISIVAILVAGIIMAFTARAPKRFLNWLSAYLVLIVGMVQLGLIVGLDDLTIHWHKLSFIAFILYNVGNIAVVTGTLLKHRLNNAWLLVAAGSACLAAAMLCLLWLVRMSERSWTLAWLTALIVVILISMPVGLTLSIRRRSR